MALNACIGREKNPEINNLRFYLKTVKKEKKLNPK